MLFALVLLLIAKMMWLLTAIPYHAMLMSRTTMLILWGYR